MLSIVIPIYNTEKYLTRCILSVTQQTLKDIEIILVNDGSTDGSGDICERLSEKDGRIKVLHKSNGGLMSAWKHGVRHATGEYIGFVDSDDKIDCDMFEKMLFHAIDSGAELVCAGLVKEYDDEPSVREAIHLKGGYYGKTEIANEIFPRLLASSEIKERLISSSRVTKLFKRDILLSVLDDCDDGITIGEDLLTAFAYLRKIDGLYIADDFFPYHYMITSQSMIRSFSEEKYDRIALLLSAMLRVNEKYGNYDFAVQIYTDYVTLYLQTAEAQALASDLRTAAHGIGSSFRCDVTRCAIRNCNVSFLSFKYRLYLFFLRHNMTYGFIFARRLKSEATRILHRIPIIG